RRFASLRICRIASYCHRSPCRTGWDRHLECGCRRITRLNLREGTGAAPRYLPTSFTQTHCNILCRVFAPVVGCYGECRSFPNRQLIRVREVDVDRDRGCGHASKRPDGIISTLYTDTYKRRGDIQWCIVVLQIDRAFDHP